MASELKMRGADFHLHYCARNQNKTIQSNELMELINYGKATIYHDNGDPSNGIDLKKTIRNYEEGRHLYFCGPTGFMAAIKNATCRILSDFIIIGKYTEKRRAVSCELRGWFLL